MSDQTAPAPSPDSIKRELQELVDLLSSAVAQVRAGRALDPAYRHRVVSRCARLALGGAPLFVVVTCLPDSAAWHTGASSRGGGHAGQVSVESTARAARLTREITLTCAQDWDLALVPDGALSPVGPPPILEQPASVEVTEELDPRDYEMLALVAKGRSNQQIGTELCYSSPTVRWRLGRLMSRWEVANRAALVAAGFHRGVLSRRPHDKAPPKNRHPAVKL